MSLPDVAALKLTLKIEHTADDTLLGTLLANALALVQKFVGTPIVAVERVMYDEAKSQTGFAPPTLVIPQTPVDSASVTINDRDGTALDMSLLRIDPETGIVRYLDGITRFEFGPYEITAMVGLDALDDVYTNEIEPVVAQAITDTAADLYYRRNAAATSESSVGVSRSYGATGLPQRVEDALSCGVRRAL